MLFGTRSSVLQVQCRGRFDSILAAQVVSLRSTASKIVQPRLDRLGKV
jgi:hypothetical protein